jgi:CBS-domain-containing membrane protein
LLFAAPDSPLAQPRNCVFGNCLGAIVSLVMVHLFGSEPNGTKKSSKVYGVRATALMPTPAVMV